MRSIIYLLILGYLYTQPANAQIGMGGQPHSSAALDVKATDKAFYPPRLSTTQRKAIVNPQAGAFVYDIDQNTFYLFDGQNWLPLAFQNPASIMPTSRVASDGAPNDRFGGSVSISGDYALVGAFNDDNGANFGQGSAYVFVRNETGWTEQAKLTASNGASGDNFGISVSISGDYALVGAHVGGNTNQGSAYVFVRTGSTWAEQVELTANDGASGEHFGNSVSISGDYALVGAYNDSNGPSNPAIGSAYIFVRSGTSWTQQAKLIASDGVPTDYFGCSVAISGDYAIVGAYLDDIVATVDQGSAYVFVRSGTSWTQQAKLTANDGATGDLFGQSVAISGNYALVGAYFDDNGAITNQGSAYVFIRSGSTWTQQAKLIANDGAASDAFGVSVALSGDYALVGAISDDVGTNTNQGSAYVFVRTSASWSQVRLITDNSPANTQNGISVGIFNGTFIIGGYGFESAKGKVTFGMVNN